MTALERLPGVMMELGKESGRGVRTGCKEKVLMDTYLMHVAQKKVAKAFGKLQAPI